MVTRKIALFVLLILSGVYLSSCASLFKRAMPYGERQNYVLELERERQILENLRDKVPASQLDMALRLNITLQKAIRSGRDARYVLFLYRIYAQKLTAILQSGGSTTTKIRRNLEVPPPPPVQQKQVTGNEQPIESEPLYPNKETVTTQEVAPPSAPECDFERAKSDYDSQNWEKAYKEFQSCVEAGVRIDEAGKYLSDIEQRVILPEWNRANLLVYQGRSESNPDRKREFLEKAEEILKGLLEKYPDNKYTPRIEKNIQLIERMLEKL